MHRKVSGFLLAFFLLSSSLAGVIGTATGVSAAVPVITGEVTPYDDSFVDLYANPDGAISGSTYIFYPDVNFRERIAFDFKRMKEVSHVNAIGFYNIVHMSVADRNALFEELERNRQKAIIRIETYDANTFDWDYNDDNHTDAKQVIAHYNTDDSVHGYTALLDYLVTHDRLKDVAYFAVNMPVDDGAVADHFKNGTYADGRANPDWSTSQVNYADDLIHRLRDILGGPEQAKLYLSVFYGWDFAYNTPSYANIEHKADGYFFNNYSYPVGNPPDETAPASVLINAPRLQQGMDRFMTQYPTEPKIIEYGFHTMAFNEGKPNNQTAGLVRTVQAKQMALKATTAFYRDGKTGGQSFNVRGTLYFAQNLYKEEGTPLSVSDWTLDYPNTGTVEAEDPQQTLQLQNGEQIDSAYSEDSAASGGRMVELAQEGMAVEFFNVNAGNALNVRYQADSATTLSLYVNGLLRKKVAFPAAADWTELYIPVNTPLLGSVKLLRDAGDGAVKVDSMFVHTNYEAEVGTDTNGVSYTDTAASNGQGVTLPADQGSYVAFPAGGVKAGTQLHIRYASASDAQLGLYVNGKLVRNVSFESTNAMTGEGSYVTAVVPVSMPAGAELRLQRDVAAAGDLNIDYVQVSGQYEAEYASGLYNGAQGQTNVQASGNGVATNFDTVGASAVFSGVQSGKQLRIRYSGTQDASMTVYMGGKAFDAVFPSTGSSDTFKDIYINEAIPNDATIVIQRNGNNNAAGLQLDAVSSIDWYEAESGVMSGGAAVQNGADASGGAEAVVGSQGAALEIGNAAAGSQLQVRYTAASDAQLSLYVNDRKLTRISFPATASGAYGISTVNVDIPAGAKLKLQYDSGDSAVTLDSFTVIEKNEAETANLIGGTVTYADAAASGGMGADVGQTGDGVEFANVKAGNKLLIRYAADGAGKLALYVNGAEKTDVVFPSIGKWKGQYNTRVVDADIPSGATVKLAYENGGSRVRIDNMDVTGIQEAENFFAKSDDVSLVNDTGASGGVGMGGFGNDGGFISFLNKNGASSLVVRYKSDAAAELTVYAKYRDDVDDASVYRTDELGVLKLPATGGVYRTAALNAYIRDGMQIIVRKEAANAADASLVIDYASFSDKLEAEAAVLGGSAEAHDEGANSTASNGRQVIATGETGASVEFDHVKAANRLAIGYTAENAGQYSLYIAKPGEPYAFSQKVTFDPTGSWSGPFAERIVDVDIPFGSKIKLQNDGAGDTPVHFDYIKLTGVYEAENGNFFGNSRTWYHAVEEPNGQSGNYWAWAFADIGDGVEIPSVRGGNQVFVRYSEGENPNTNGQLGLILNGNYVQDIVMPYTGSWGNYKIAGAELPVADGSVLKLQNTKQTDHTAPIDYIEVRDKQREAENANRYGSAAIAADAGAGYGLAVGGLETDGSAVEFPGMNAGGSLAIRYKSDSEGTLSLYVNEMKKQTVAFPAAADGQYGVVTVNAEIPKGATVKLKRDSGDTWNGTAFLDSIQALGTYAADQTYEAENGILDGADVAADENLSGGWKVGPIGDGGSVEFKDLSVGRAVLIRYATTDASAKQLKLYVNGQPNQTVSLPATEGGAFATVEAKVHIPKGASVTLKNEGFAEGAELDYIRVSGKYEAEYAGMNGQSDDGHKPMAIQDAAASNGQAAAHLWAPDNGTGSFVFPGVEAGTSLKIAYASGDANTRKLSLYINGTKQRSVEFPAYENGGWDGHYNVITVPVTIPEGAEVKLQKDQGDSEVNIDYIEVQGLYEAEDASLLGSAYVSADAGGNRGLAVGGINTPASGVDFRNVIAGNTVTIRYASQDAGTLYLYAGGAKKKISFPSTGGFTGQYATVSVPVQIGNGEALKLVFEANPGENPVSLDNVSIYTDNGQTVENGMEITSTAAGQALLVKYTSTTDGLMSLYVDGQFKQKVTFPNTNGNSGAKEFKLSIPSGVSVKLQDDGDPDVAVNLVDMLVSDKYEAEYSNLFGVDADGHYTSAFNDGPASNGEAVHFIWGEGSYLEFPNTAAGNRVVVGYSSGEAGRHLSLYVNGNKKADIPFGNTGGWTGNYQEVTVPVDIPAGATVKIQRDPGDSDVIIDYLKIKTEGTDPGPDPEPDTEAPTAPFVSSSDVTASSVVLTWTASTDNAGVSGYDVYQGATKIAAVTGTQYTVTGLRAGTAYTFKVSAKDAAGNVSAASNTVEVTTGAGSGQNQTPNTTPTQPEKPVPIEGKVALKPVLKDGTATAAIDAATVEKAISQAAADASGVKTIQLAVEASQEAKEYRMELPTGIFESGKTDLRLEVVTPAGTVFMTTEMFGTLDLHGHEHVGLTMAPADISRLDPITKSRIGNRPVIDLQATVDGNPVAWSNPNAPVMVRLAYTPTAQELANPDQITVWYIDGQGALHAVPSGKFDAATGEVTFRTTHFSQYAVAYQAVSFTDIAKFAWAQQAIRLVSAKGIMEGSSSGKFNPAANITRAEFVDALIKTLNLAADTSSDVSFADVERNAPYSASIAVAKKLGIAYGDGNGRFKPNASITREEMAALTVRALIVANGFPTQGTLKDLASFKDAAAVSGYAVESMASLAKAGILKGSGGKIDPKGHLTRAQAAVVMYNLYSK
ncbi:carbohydrate-binding domain-containing protein [Cohnella candidum]|uniref:Carbohydrate-binding protein n=1 Tax=Cohnella candidum TaxID=2674991 RepID=A0A3G3K0R2_9BACL|nr:carbohydrate-binding domain-containing protein [Cohnella candidum]AYQ73721.1 hypothetical protein EAV92_14715 [Cohnella candidum]